MKLTWLGHSCFAVESGGYRVVLDPYYVESYPPLHTSANEVLCSHHHRDHDFVDAVELTPRGGSPSTTIRAARCAGRTPSMSSLPRGCASCISATSVTS